WGAFPRRNWPRCIASMLAMQRHHPMCCNLNLGLWLSVVRHMGAGHVMPGFLLLALLACCVGSSIHGDFS
ncbi:MAG: hypothetical protein LBK55_02905, partial [Azoarcus sp.]|nr:hypothetical protein [Azoarcus sp.]